MEPQYYLNTYSTYSLTDRIRQIIRDAKKYIKTGNFFFFFLSMLEELKEDCKRGVVVFILSNLRDDENRLVAGNKFKKEEYDPHIPNLMDLVAMGAHVRCISELHAKFLLSDGTSGMIMSSNYTIDSLFRNPECGVDLCNNDLIYLERLFDTIFTHADIRLAGRKKDGYRFLRYSSLIDPKVFQQNETDILMTLAPHKNTETNLANCNIISLYNKIATIINNAEGCVFLAAFSFRDIDKLPLVKNALLNAANKNVEIFLIYNSEHYRNEKEISPLQTRFPNIKPWGIPKNHAKFLFTEKEGMIFTSNIDGEIGLLTGFELGVRLSKLQHDQCINSIQKLQQEIKNKKYE